MSQRLCVLGECMLEISAENLTGSNVGAGLSYGGDTLNTAVYFARLGGDVHYLSALGDDALSTWMVDLWRAEGVGCDFVERVSGAAPGLYLIQVDETGERSFVYWRDQSPARALLQSADRLSSLLQDAVSKSDLFYVSGITLALMSSEAHQALFDFAKGFRSGGGCIAFDSNHRPGLWPDADTARSVYEAMYANTDIALSTADDEYDLFGGHLPSEIVERLRGCGVREVLVKDGNEGCLLHAEDVVTLVPALAVPVVDTTAAGDSFNAAYLKSRAAGADVISSAKAGHTLAASVIGHRGAIIPTERMPDLATKG